VPGLAQTLVSKRTSVIEAPAHRRGVVGARPGRGAATSTRRHARRLVRGDDDRATDGGVVRVESKPGVGTTVEIGWAG
jgi:hypothetical protein